MAIGIHSVAPDDPYTSLRREIQELRQQVRELAAARTLENATIGQGGLQITNGGGVTVVDPTSGRMVFYVGSYGFLDGSGRTQMVMLSFRDDGTPALQMLDGGVVNGHTHQQALQWFDRASNIVFADDTNGGQGIAVPYIPFGPFASNNVPTDTTTSATYTTLQTAIGYWMNPKVFIQLIVRSSDSATTGNVRVIDQAGNVIGAPVAVAGNDFKYVNIGPVAMPGSFKLSVSLNIQAQVTAGTGTIGVRGVGAIGLQS